MSIYVKEERMIFEENGDERKEILGNISSRINKGGEPPTPSMDQEKRIRREIANSNERRRMQSINNGFQSLRSLLPHHEGEKLSKAAILQQTAEYIYSLEQEKTRLLSQNCQLKRLVNQHEGGELLPPKKRRTDLLMAAAAVETSEEVVEEADDGEAAAAEAELCQELLVTVSETGLPEASAAAAELKRQLERERGLRSILEEQVRQLETQLFQQQAQQQTQIFEVDESDAIGLQLLAADSLPPVGHTQTVGCSPPNSRSVSPAPPLAVNVVSTAVAVEQRLPSVLEAAIKAEPKVEVERLPTTTASSGHEDPATASRIYVSNTTRQNLETIVEAIRHLEGDHMFGDEPHAQDAPLALTTHAQRTPDSVLKADMQNYLDFNAARLQQHQQSRPGVIVVKQAS